MLLIAGLGALIGSTSVGMSFLCSMIKLRNCVGDKLEVLLKEIVSVAIETKVLKRLALKHVNVDTTFHEKAIS